MTQHGEKSTVARGAGVPLRVALYVALAASALLTMAGLPALQQRVEAGTIQPLWLLAPSCGFGLFLAVYVADRIWLMRFRKYPSGRALFQILLGIVFLMLLLPSSIREYRSIIKSRPARDSLSALVRHKEPRVRAIACELTSYRKEARHHLPALGHALTDRDTHVREAARTALQRITGQSFSTDRQGQRALEQYLHETAQIPEPESAPAAPEPTSAPAAPEPTSAPAAPEPTSVPAATPASDEG